MQRLSVELFSRLHVKRNISFKMGKICLIALFLTLFTNFSLAQDCQYTHIEKYIEFEFRLTLENSTKIVGMPLLIEPSEHYYDVNYSTTSFYVTNTLNEEIVVEFKYYVEGYNQGYHETNRVFKPNTKVRVSHSCYNSINRSWEFCKIVDRSIEYKVVKPFSLVLQEVPIEKERVVCNLCQNNRKCLNDGVRCTNNNECGSGYCVLNICSTNEYCYNNNCLCKNNEVQCFNSFCVQKERLDIGEKPACSKLECSTNYLDFETGLCAKDPVVIESEKKRNYQILIFSIFLFGVLGKILFIRITRKKELIIAIESKIKNNYEKSKKSLSVQSLHSLENIFDKLTKEIKTTKTEGLFFSKYLIKKIIERIALIEHYKRDIIKRKIELICRTSLDKTKAIERRVLRVKDYLEYNKREKILLDLKSATEEIEEVVSEKSGKYHKEIEDFKEIISKIEKSKSKIILHIQDTAKILEVKIEERNSELLKKLAERDLDFLDSSFDDIIEEIEGIKPDKLFFTTSFLTSISQKNKTCIDNYKRDIINRKIELICKGKLSFAKKELYGINQKDTYLTYEDRKLLDEKIKGLVIDLKNIIKSKYVKYVANSGKIIKDTIQNIENINSKIKSFNENFVKKEKKKYKELFKTENYYLDDNQQSAIIKDDKYNLVVAGAGSGKTEVLTSRIKYLLARKNNFVRPNQILALAFGNDAVKIMKNRLPKEVKNQIMTFHSLGQRIVNKPLLTNRKENYNREREKIINSIFLKKYQEEYFFGLLIDYLGEFALVKENIRFEEKENYYKELITSNKLKTISGDKVASEGERKIFNFFFSHKLNGKDIEFEYEKPADWMEYEKENKEKKIPHPDFYFNGFDIYWEHWALDEKGRVPEKFIDYQKGMQLKQKKFREHSEKTLIESNYGESKDSEKFKKILKIKFLSALRKKYPSEKFELEQIDYKELIEKIYTRSEKGWYEGRSALQTLHKNISSFINNAKVYRNSPEKIERILKKENSNDIGVIFTKIALDVYREYEKELHQIRKVIDFNDMINEAVDILNNGKYPLDFKPEHILIDEFQDISKQRFELVKCIQNYNPKSHLFCVGDDWQSIMAFAGADLNYFVGFKEKVTDFVEETKLKYNYRCGESIVDYGNKIINVNITKNETSQIKKEVSPSQEKKGLGEINVIYYKDRKADKEIYTNLLNEVKRLNQDKVSKENILVLGRYKLNEEYNLPSKIYDELEKFARIKTIHTSKGDQADYVFLVNVESGVYGFPSEINNSYLFKFARGDDSVNLGEEERRLFYVAVTRAKKSIYILASNKFKSIFIEELKNFNLKNLKFIDEKSQLNDYLETNNKTYNWFTK